MLPAALSAAVLAACKRSDHPVAPTDAGVRSTLTAQAARRRPAPPGDFRRGWALFRENCAGCHGANRRGRGTRQGLLPVPPADLRDPVLLASRSNDELVNAILHGVRQQPARHGEPEKKEMPGFDSELGEQDALDLVGFLRGDSIYLSECFPDATHYLELQTSGGRLLRAYTVDGIVKQPVLLDSASDLPSKASPLGYVMFVELDLPGAGATPVAFLADQKGAVSGVRVALPEPDCIRAETDILAVLERGAEGAPKLRGVVPAIEASKQWLAQTVADDKTTVH